MPIQHYPYSYPEIPQDLNKCLSNAETALTKLGYKIYNRNSQKVGSAKGEFRAVIICGTAKYGVAVIIVNGENTDPVNEVKAIHKAFVN